METKGFSKTILRVILVFVLFFVSLPASATFIIVRPPLPCDVFPEIPECQPVPEKQRNPIVLVPGLVASYNKRVLYKDKPGGIWSFVPFGNIYAGLVARLQSIGYSKNKDLFIAYYDWRQGNEQSAREYLAPVIKKAVAASETGKIDIIAHSMGGLLVQAYVHSDQFTAGEIDALVMLGTPNNGSSSAYLPWEGGILPSTWNTPTKWYVNSIEDSLKLVKKVNADAPITYRQFFPSLKELLPLESILYKEGDEIPIGERNNFLIALKEARDSFLNSSGINVTTIAGDNGNTIRWVNITKPRTEDDIATDRWRDGHPDQEVPPPGDSGGDTTVVTDSALLGKHDILLSNISHTELPEHAQNEILTTLGLLDEGPKQFIYQEPESITGFVVLSPVDITFTSEFGYIASKDRNDFGDDVYVDTDSEEEDDPKIMLFRNIIGGTNTVTLTGTATGPYSVIVTHVGEYNVSKTFTGNTAPGKEESFTIHIDSNGVTISDLSLVKEGNSPKELIVKESGHPRGDEQDCCPGHDPVTKKKGKVLGAIKKIKRAQKKFNFAELAPLNDVFFSVHHRLPTYEEWKYWADRYINDKRNWEAIRGAMAWHKEHRKK